MPEDDFNELKKEPQWDSSNVVHASLLEPWERGDNILTHRVRLNTIIKSDGFNEQYLCQNGQRRLGANTTPFIPIIDEDCLMSAPMAQI